MVLNVSIGILAHNEALSISTTLQSLFQQSLFNEPDPQQAIEIVVVANGCTDETAAVSRATLEALVKQAPHPNIRWRVCEVEQPGKTNAWNLYVHEFSAPAADYLFLMDADIEFIDPHTLRYMLDTLETKPNAWVSVDVPIKDVALKEKKNLVERLSASASASFSAASGDVAAICGQLYCGRATVLRGIWMPPGLQVEDGFLRAMVVTDRFTSPEVSERVVLAKSASHIFEAYTDLNRLLRHERWLVVGSTINAFIFGYLWANCNRELDAGSLIKHQNDQDPFWLHQFIQAAVLEKGWWVIPQPFLFRRFQRLRQYPPLKQIVRFPVAVIAFLVDLLVFFQANQELRRGGGMGYWGKPQGARTTVLQK
jgi:glycosyltransferase involved in cell wall biosynthesis